MSLRDSLRHHGIAEHLHPGLVRYALFGIRPGGFLRACLAGDTATALAYMGEDLPANTPERVLAWARSEMPASATGTWTAVEAWRGLDAEAA